MYIIDIKNNNGEVIQQRFFTDMIDAIQYARQIEWTGTIRAV